MSQQRFLGELEQDTDRVHLSITCSDGSKTERFVDGPKHMRYIAQITADGIWTYDAGDKPVLWRRVDRIEIHR